MEAAWRLKSTLCHGYGWEEDKRYHCQQSQQS
jgi:hypothetical protein